MYIHPDFSFYFQFLINQFEGSNILSINLMPYQLALLLIFILLLNLIVVGNGVAEYKRQGTEQWKIADNCTKTYQSKPLSGSVKKRTLPYNANEESCDRKFFEFVESQFNNHAILFEGSENSRNITQHFKADKNGWLGGDVSTSFRIATDTSGKESGMPKYLWLFGDTFIGHTTIRKGRLVEAGPHNSVGTLSSFIFDKEQQGNFWEVEHHISETAFNNYFNNKYVENLYWNGSDIYKKYDPKSWKSSASLFLDDEDNSGFKLWPISGIFSAFSNEIVLFATRYMMNSNATLGFEIVGTTAIIVTNPDEKPTKWNYRQIKIPGTNSDLNFFTALSIGINSRTSLDKNQSNYSILNTEEVIYSKDDIIYLVGTYKNDNIIGRIKYESLEKFNFLDGLQVMISCHQEEKKWLPWGEYLHLSTEQATTNNQNSLMQVKLSPHQNFIESKDPISLHLFNLPNNTETSLFFRPDLQMWGMVLSDMKHAELKLAFHFIPSVDISSNPLSMENLDVMPYEPGSQEWIVYPKPLYRVPPPFNNVTAYYIYGAKYHNEFSQYASNPCHKTSDDSFESSSQNKLNFVLTYNRNPTNFNDLFSKGAINVLYTPVFVNVSLVFNYIK